MVSTKGVQGLKATQTSHLMQQNRGKRENNDKDASCSSIHTALKNMIISNTKQATSGEKNKSYVKSKDPTNML